ncbi:MAG: histidine phosphatase family protein [Ruminococcus sp.]|nr:histidine phosphatase family protein [Ruminococcus sp.]
MKLLIIRHGDPDYEHDCLTDLGREQAVKLAARLAGTKIDGVYSSPMGRARETAGFYCDLTGREAVVLPWLHEFDVKITDTELNEPVVTWDMLPSHWTKSPLLYDRVGYSSAPELAGSDMHSRALSVGEGLDALLTSYGLIREGNVYRKEGECGETLALFCHFGVGCVMIAHLLGISPMVALNGLSADPTAVATLCTDDRFPTLVNFRLHGYNDRSHL